MSEVKINLKRKSDKVKAVVKAAKEKFLDELGITPVGTIDQMRVDLHFSGDNKLRNVRILNWNHSDLNWTNTTAVQILKEEIDEFSEKLALAKKCVSKVPEETRKVSGYTNPLKRLGKIGVDFATKADQVLSASIEESEQKLELEEIIQAHHVFWQDVRQAIMIDVEADFSNSIVEGKFNPFLGDVDCGANLTDNAKDILHHRAA